MGGAKSVPSQSQVTRSGAFAPALAAQLVDRRDRYYDTVVDDARHSLTVARRGPLRRGHPDVDAGRRLSPRGRPGDGVRVRDSDTGAIQVRAHCVINAAGVWTDEVQALSKERGPLQGPGVRRVCTSSCRATGSSARRPSSCAPRTPCCSSSRGSALDHRYHRHRLEPRSRPPRGNPQDIDYILDRVNEVLVSPLTHDDIEGVYAGLRPLLAGEDEGTSTLSREHAVAVVAPASLSIAGGKYTTYRVMGADAVDACNDFIPTRVAPSITERVPAGADGYFALINQCDFLGSAWAAPVAACAGCSTATDR